MCKDCLPRHLKPILKPCVSTCLFPGRNLRQELLRSRQTDSFSSGSSASRRSLLTQVRRPIGGFRQRGGRPVNVEIKVVLTAHDSGALCITKGQFWVGQGSPESIIQRYYYSVGAITSLTAATLPPLSSLSAPHAGTGRHQGPGPPRHHPLCGLAPPPTVRLCV